jgi:signal peptidase II
MKRYIYAVLLILFIIVSDQVTKYLVVKFLTPYNSIEIFPFLYIVNVKNTGAAFGILKNLSSSFFIGVSVLAVLFMIWLLVRSNYSTTGLSLLLGGAIGNVIDRIRYGKVVDFIDFSVGDFHWPAFNIADSCLTLGIIIILLFPLMKKR